MIGEIAEQEFPLAVAGDGYYIDHRWDGRDVLHFEVARAAEHADLVVNEARIHTSAGWFLIKNVDARGDYLYCDCEIDLDAWRAGFWHEYRRTDSTLATILAEIKPTGWTVTGAEAYTQRKTVEASDQQPLMDANALDILTRTASIWGCVYNFDNVGKVVKVINPDAENESGVWLSEETNMTKKVDYTGSSVGFATRLYAYGKKDEATGQYLTIASVNDGKEYVENKGAQVDRIISVGWTDERFTIAQNLKDAAEAKLAEIAAPVVSYSVQLREVDADLKMYTTAAFIGSKTQHRVVEYREYPERHDLDSVTLSAVEPSISVDVYGEITTKVASLEQTTESNTERISAIEDTAPWIASDTDLGAVIVGDGLTADVDGTLAVNLGNGLELNAQTGAIDVTGGGGSSWDGKIGGLNNQYGTIKQYGNTSTATTPLATWDNKGISFSSGFLRFLNGTTEVIKATISALTVAVTSTFSGIVNITNGAVHTAWRRLLTVWEGDSKAIDIYSTNRSDGSGSMMVDIGNKSIAIDDTRDYEGNHETYMDLQNVRKIYFKETGSGDVYSVEIANGQLRVSRVGS
jgi:phage minor structural protein